MANAEHLAILKQGRDAWTDWRKQNLQTIPDLSFADLSGFDLREFKLFGADLRGADLTEAYIALARLSTAKLMGVRAVRASFIETNFIEANLAGADLREATLIGCNLSRADFSAANLSGATLTAAILIETNLERANLSECRVYGIAAWNLKLKGTIQSNLILTPPNEPMVQTDNIEVAQFIYLLLNNQKIRHVIDTITSKVVLILGRFTPERKAVLDAIRDELRKRDYLPVLFDFEKPSNRDITETVSTLAHMARFVIADITDAKSIPQELMAIVPSLPSVPVQPLLLASQQEYGMFEHFKRYPWVLEPYLYEDQDRLLAAITEKVIGPAETMAKGRTGR
jgi:uncharacterized protein YjbI with pentapeptide repeats